MNDFSVLLCGGNSEGSAKIVLDQLASSIDRFSSKAIKFLTDDVGDEVLSFGPFCARVLLENSCAALVGRFDSFRMLYLSEFQAQPEYELGKRAKSAFAWTGDVMPDEKGNADLWSADHDISKISRALFSRYFDHIFWKPALNRMIDYISGTDERADRLLQDVITIEPERFIKETKGHSVRIYSTLSKGVHWEFFTSALVFDEATVKDSIRDAVLLVAKLGLVSHFVHTAYASLDLCEAVARFKKIRGLIS